MKGRVTVEGTQELELDEGPDLGIYTVEFSVKAQCWYTPARLGGPPEDCYPEESEIELEEVTVTKIQGETGELELTPERETAFNLKLNYDAISDLVWEDFMSLGRE